ncbi:hypothetical protein AGLY_009589 [Aphis glycines]|uniref:Uncharacterized protein n=1 Tax=Aphis glycines TaxID=307491 RepID=A0A6G0TIH3_APHGL|nr:hypothetical protein AGLY_009589 [Aphis glycines]
MSTVTALFHAGGTLLYRRHVLIISVNTVHSGSRRFQCRYVSPSSPGAVFSNFPRRFDTSAHWNGPIGTGSLPSTRWNILVSHVDGAHVLVKCSSTSGTASSQDCPSPDTITLTARRLLRLYRDWISLASFGSIAVPLPELRPSRLAGSLAMDLVDELDKPRPPRFRTRLFVESRKTFTESVQGCRVVGL